MRIKSPPIVPGFDFEVCLVLDDFGRFRVYREADENETDRETVIWSRDITEGIAREIVERAARRGEPLSKAAQQFVGWATGETIPAALAYRD